MTSFIGELSGPLPPRLRVLSLRPVDVCAFVDRIGGGLLCQIRFDPPVPKSCLVHTYFGAPPAVVLRALDAVEASTGVRVLRRVVRAITARTVGRSDCGDESGTGGAEARAAGRSEAGG